MKKYVVVVVVVVVGGIFAGINFIKTTNNCQSLFKLVFIGIFVPFVCAGQQKANQKYSLLNPVPRALMREMETNRKQQGELCAGYITLCQISIFEI